MLSEESREVHGDLLEHEHDTLTIKTRRHLLPLGFYGYRPPSSPQQLDSEVLTTSSVEK